MMRSVQSPQQPNISTEELSIMLEDLAKELQLDEQPMKNANKPQNLSPPYQTGNGFKDIFSKLKEKLSRKSVSNTSKQPIHTNVQTINKNANGNTTYNSKTTIMPDISNPLVMSIIVEKIVDDAKKHFNKQVLKNNPEEVTTLLDAINNDINNTLIAFSVGKNNFIVPNAFNELQPIRSEIQKTYTGSTDISKYLDEYISSILNLRNDAHKFKSTLLFGLRIQFDQINNEPKKSIVYIFIAIPHSLSENHAVGIIDDKGIDHPIQQNNDILNYIKSSLSFFFEKT